MQTRSAWPDFLAGKLAPGEGDPFPAEAAPNTSEPTPAQQEENDDDA